MQPERSPRKASFERHARLCGNGLGKRTASWYGAMEATLFSGWIYDR
jgi:hypothetical protein